MKERKKKFQVQCEAIAEELGIHVMFFPDSPSKPCEDDGNLHITKRGLRACFGVGLGQSLGPKEQNANSQLVLDALGITKFDKSAVMLDETEDEDDECPHCGRSSCH